MKILIAGASGLVGHAAAKHFASLPDWDVVGIYRRPPATSPVESVTYVQADLADAEQCTASLSDGKTSRLSHHARV